MNLIWEFTYDELNHAQYYGGHGHAFVTKNFLGCIFIGVPAYPEQTYGELIDSLVEGFNASEVHIPFNEVTIKQEQEIRDKWYDLDVRELIKNDLPHDAKFNNVLVQGVQDFCNECNNTYCRNSTDKECDNPSHEDWYHYCYIHIYNGDY